MVAFATLALAVAGAAVITGFTPLFAGDAPLEPAEPAGPADQAEEAEPVEQARTPTGEASAYEPGAGTAGETEGSEDVSVTADDVRRTTAAPGATAASEGSSTTPASTSPTATAGPPFSLEVGSIERCGVACRDVTATVTNEQERRAEDVTVRTRVYAGDSTDAADRVWSGTERVGTLEAGASATSTARVELGVVDAATVRANGGRVTVVTTVESDETTVRFEETRTVL